MPVATSGVTPDRFAATMRRLEQVAPMELNTALVDVARRVVLPRAKTRAPHRSGRLAGSLSVVPGGARGAAIRSTLPYANVQHWGGRTWYARSAKPWPSPVPVGRSIKGKRFVQGVLEQDIAAVTRAIGDELDRMVLKHFGGM